VSSAAGGIYKSKLAGSEVETQYPAVQPFAVTFQVINPVAASKFVKTF
jgi:hypothetical protein